MDKKQQKLEAKRLKKQLKAEKKSGISSDQSREKSSFFVLYAEAIRGLIYIVTGLSIVAAIVLGQKGVIVTLDQIVENLLFANLGKVILALIATSLVLYGLKNLRLLK